MKTKVMSALLLLVLAACDKKEPAVSGSRSGSNPVPEPPGGCKEWVVADQPVRVNETDMYLPAGTKMCLSPDELEMRVELPEGFSFYTPGVANKTLPYYESTYTCLCSREGSPCTVFYASGMGFGCLQSSCSGSCTGKFTYMGYSLDKVFHTGDKAAFLGDPEMQALITKDYLPSFKTVAKNVRPENLVYVKQELLGVVFYVLQERNTLSKSLAPEKVLPYEQAMCDCGGTKACTLKTITLGKGGMDIYFCQGKCNGCELTVD